MFDAAGSDGGRENLPTVFGRIDKANLTKAETNALAKVACGAIMAGLGAPQGSSRETRAGAPSTAWRLRRWTFRPSGRSLG